jgi:ParB family chromosome partitioning protein
MPPKADGAKRSDILIWPPEELPKLRRGPNPSRSNMGSDLRLEELAASIAARGQLQPGIVRRDSQGLGVVVAGNRRLDAIALINQEPAKWLDGNGKPLAGPLPFRASLIVCNDEEALELNLVENLERLDLNAVDRAHTARELTKLDWTLERIGGVMKCSPSTVSALISLLSLPARTLRLVADGKLPEAGARALRGLPEEEVLALSAEIAAGARPASVLKKVREQKRASGKSQPRSLSEIKKALSEQGSDQADALLRWIAGDPGVELADAKLADFPAPTVKQLQSAARKADRAAATAAEVAS